MTGSSPWVWVVEGAYAVDPAELTQAAVTLGEVANLVGSAVSLAAPLFGHVPTFDHLEAMAASPTPALDAQIRSQQRGVRADLGNLLRGIGNLQAWLSHAALLYYVAEKDAAGYFAACESLEVPQCAAGVGTGGTRNLLAQFRLEGGPPATSGLVTQLQVGQVAGSTPMFATQAAALMEDLGRTRSGSSLGVVVQAQGVAAVPGRTLWGTAHALQGQGAQVVDLQKTTPGDPLGAAIAEIQQQKQHKRPGPAAVIPTPLTAGALLERAESSRSSPSVGQVQILKHKTKKAGTQQTSWTVVVRGTQSWSPGSRNPHDLASNLQEVGRETSDLRVATELAMELAEIPPQDPVEIVGHSQGGLMAGGLIVDSRLTKKYRFVSSLTAGSPTGSYPAPRQVQVLNMENLADFVPSLDGAPAPRGQNVTTIHFDGRNVQVPSGSTAHSVETYVAAANKMEEQLGHDPQLQALQLWQKQRQELLGIDETTETEVQFYDSARVLEGRRLRPAG